MQGPGVAFRNCSWLLWATYKTYFLSGHRSDFGKAGRSFWATSRSYPALLHRRARLLTSVCFLVLTVVCKYSKTTNSTFKHSHQQLTYTRADLWSVWTTPASTTSVLPISTPGRMHDRPTVQRKRIVKRILHHSAEICTTSALRSLAPQVTTPNLKSAISTLLLSQV